MKFDFTGKVVKDLDGTEILDEKGNVMYVGRQLSRMLAFNTDTQRDPVKLTDIAEALQNHGVVELDTSDRDLVIQVVKSSQGVSAILKSRILACLRDEAAVKPNLQVTKGGRK